MYRTHQIWGVPPAANRILTPSRSLPGFLHSFASPLDRLKAGCTYSLYTTRQQGSISRSIDQTSPEHSVYSGKENSYIRSRSPIRSYHNGYKKSYTADYSFTKLQHNSRSQSTNTPFVNRYLRSREKSPENCVFNKYRSRGSYPSMGKATKLSNINRVADKSSGRNEPRNKPFRSRFLKSRETPPGAQSSARRARLSHLGVGIQHNRLCGDIMPKTSSGLTTDPSRKKLFTVFTDNDIYSPTQCQDTFKGCEVLIEPFIYNSDKEYVNVPTSDGAYTMPPLFDKPDQDTSSLTDNVVGKESQGCSRFHLNGNKSNISVDSLLERREFQKDDAQCAFQSDSSVVSTQNAVCEPLDSENKRVQRSSHFVNANRKRHHDDVCDSDSQCISNTQSLRSNLVNNSLVEVRTPKIPRKQTQTTASLGRTAQEGNYNKTIDLSEEASLPDVWDGCPVVLNHLKSVAVLDGDTVTLKCKVIGKT